MSCAMVHSQITTSVLSLFCSDYGNQYLTSQDIPYNTTWDLWMNEVALFVIACGFFVFSYIQLRRLNKLR